MPPLFDKDRARDGIRVHGIVLAHGAPQDLYGACDVSVFQSGHQYAMYYDAQSGQGWLLNQAVSMDLVHWQKKGLLAGLDAPSAVATSTTNRTAPDAGCLCYATAFLDGSVWRLFYTGAATASPTRLAYDT